MDSNLTFREEDDVVVVDVCGKLTAGRLSAELRALLRELASAGYRNILLNLSRVLYMDCEGLGKLVASYASVTRTRGDLKLLNPQWPVRNIFHASGLDKVIEIYEREDEAILSFYSVKPQQIEEIFCGVLSTTSLS